MSERVAAAAPGTPGSLASRHRRGAFLAALAAVVLGTLWPRLELAPADSPIDKLAHAAGFGILAGTAFLAFPRLRIPYVAAGLLAFAALDELAQSIPGLGRTTDALDLAADAAGIAIAAAYALALRPVPGAGNAALLARRRACAADLLLCRPLNCLHFLPAAAVGALAGAPAAVFIDSWFVRKGPQPWQFGLIGGVLGAGVAVHALWEAGIRAMLRKAGSARPCLGCGSPLPGGAAPCAACGRAGAERDWAPVATARAAIEWRACAVPVAVAFAALLALNVAALSAVAVLRLRVDAVGRFDDWFRNLPPDAQRLADVLPVALLGAWALRRCRVRLAAIADRGGDECLACGYDLRCTAPGAPGGTCQECGQGFVRAGPAGAGA